MPQKIVGTPGNDFIDAIDDGNLDNLIYGLEGDDTVLGWDGDDYINGGDGNGSLYGEAGDDIIDGWSGDDYISGGSGDGSFGGVGANRPARAAVVFELKRSLLIDPPRALCRSQK